MLQQQTVEPNTLLVLKKIMQVAALHSFYLVGGTCLALRYGHRTSIDLDLFSVVDFTNEGLSKILTDNNILFRYNNLRNPIGLFGYVDDIKVDFVKHHYFKQIDKPELEDGIRMFGDRDIMAIKIFAISQRAQKKIFGI